MLRKKIETIKIHNPASNKKLRWKYLKACSKSSYHYFEKQLGNSFNLESFNAPFAYLFL